MKEKIYEIEAVVKLEIPIDELPMAAVKSIDEISSDEAIEGKLVQLHTQIKKDLEGEFVKVKSGVYENMAMGWITEVKKISLGTRTWKEVK
jgi:hypothetical protein